MTDDKTLDSLEPIFTPKELAERWKISVKTVHRRISAGTLFAFGENLRTARIPLSAIQDFEARRCPRSGIGNSGPESDDLRETLRIAQQGIDRPRSHADLECEESIAYQVARRMFTARKQPKPKRL